MHVTLNLLTELLGREVSWLTRYATLLTDNSNGRGEGSHWNVREVWEGNLECKCVTWKQETDPNHKVIAWEHLRQTGHFQNKVQLIGGQWIMGGPGQFSYAVCT